MSRWQWLRGRIAAGEVPVGIVHLEPSEFPGAGVLLARVNSLSAPIGTLWYRHSYDECTVIAYVHVHEELRRLGVCTRLVRELGCCWPDQPIVTPELSAYGGSEAFPRIGFVKSDRGPFWVLPAGASPAPQEE
jgi:hypothetical protein